MYPTIRRTALSLATAALMIVAPLTPQVFAAPRVVDTIDVGNGPYSVAFSPKGKKAYVANVGDHTISVIKIR